MGAPSCVPLGTVPFSVRIISVMSSMFFCFCWILNWYFCASRKKKWNQVGKNEKVCDGGGGGSGDDGGGAEMKLWEKHLSMKHSSSQFVFLFCLQTNRQALGLVLQHQILVLELLRVLIDLGLHLKE